MGHPGMTPNLLIFMYIFNLEHRAGEKHLISDLLFSKVIRNIYKKYFIFSWKECVFFIVKNKVLPFFGAPAKDTQILRHLYVTVA